MAKRVVIEFICDVCAKIVAYEQLNSSFVGSVFKIRPYPEGWKFHGRDGKVVDVCPDCPIPEREIVKQ